MNIFTKNTNMFLEKLQSFKYGCMFTDGKIYTNLNDIQKKDGQNIYIQSPEEFWNHKTGMCHDASIFIDALLTKENINHTCYFLVSEEPPYYPTHSFVIAEFNGFYYIIDVFSQKSCIYPLKFNSLKEAYKYRTDLWIKDDNDNKSNIHLLQSIHMPKPKVDFITFFDNVIHSFTEISFL